MPPPATTLALCLLLPCLGNEVIFRPEDDVDDRSTDKLIRTTIGEQEMSIDDLLALSGDVLSDKQGQEVRGMWRQHQRDVPKRFAMPSSFWKQPQMHFR